jgi:hypothetical protein
LPVAADRYHIGSNMGFALSKQVNRQIPGANGRPESDADFPSASPATNPLSHRRGNVHPGKGNAWLISLLVHWASCAIMLFVV